MNQARYYSSKHFWSGGRGVRRGPAFHQMSSLRGAKQGSERHQGGMERKPRSQGPPRTLLSKLTDLLSSHCLFILLICFPGSYNASSLPEKTVDAASHDAISRHRIDHVPKWKPTKVHYPAFFVDAPVASVENAFVASSTSNSAALHGRVETNFELSYAPLFPPPVQRDRRVLFMLNSYDFNATESYVINTLQTLTSWCERGEEIHVALYTSSHELASYVSDKKQRFFCKRLSSSLPIAVLEYDKNITINIAGMHRYLVADKIKEYDWFLYTEDDLALTHSHVRFLQKWTRVLAPEGILPHLMRYEVAPVRSLGLRRDALLFDEYPMPLSLFRMEVTDAEMATRGLDFDEEDELDDRDDRSETNAAALWFSEDKKGPDKSSDVEKRFQGDIASLLSHRRARRSARNSPEESHKKLPHSDSFSSATKTSRGRTVSAASHANKNDTVFIRVPNPYMAMWLLPRDMLLSHVRESRWLNEVNDCPNTDVRVHFATFWLLPHFAFTVPLSSLRRALIHHVSTKYAGHGLMQVDADRREASHPFFLHRYYNVDAWDLERTLSECTEGIGGRSAGDDKNEKYTDSAAVSAVVASASYKRLVHEHPTSIALQSPRLLSISTCSSCFTMGGNVTIDVSKREKGEPLEYKVECLQSERKRQ